MNTTRISTATLLFCLLAILLVVFTVFSLWDLASKTDFGETDFMVYWSATYLVHNGENPYNLQSLRLVQQTQPHLRPEITAPAWNPPVLFVFLMPLVGMSFINAKFAWLIISIMLVITAGLMLTDLYMAENSWRVKLGFLIFAMSFPAVISGLYMGQVTFLVFWGLTACVFLIKKEQWFWAGAVLIMTTIKPHITILAVIYILIYMARHHKYQGWAGLAIAGFTCLIIPLIFCPDLIYYLIGDTSVASDRWATSTIGGLLSYFGLSEAARYLILLFLPLPFLLAKHPEKINMELSVALLTLITVPTTFFGWSYDQTILLVPIAQVFSWLARSKHKLPIIACIVVATGFYYYQRVLPLHEVYYVWVPLVWWFIFGITWWSISLWNNNYAQQKL